MALRERLIKVDERRNVAWKQASDMIMLAAGEDRPLTAEERSQYEDLVGEVRSLGEERELIVEHEARTRELEAPRRDIRLLPGAETGAPTRGGRFVDTDEYRDAFRAYVRGGERRMRPDQLAVLDRGMVTYTKEERALTTGTGSSGGYTIPQGFEATLTKARLAFGGVRQSRARKSTTETGNTIPIPSLNDTGNKGVLLAENTQMTTQDVAFGTRNLKAYVMHSKAVLVPWQLIQDSAFDVEDEILAPAFGERIGRIENDYFTTGTGTDQPLGIVTAATTALTGSGAAAGGPTYAEYVRLFHSVDPAYRAMAEWMASDALIESARLVVDDNNRPIWLPAATGGLQDDVPDRIMGKRVIVNQSMDSPATVSGYPLIFGDMSYYWIRDVRGIQTVRLDERYADYLQTGFFAYARTDGTLVDPGTPPIKKYRSAAA